ncbi:MAG: hypothetical protein Q8905_16475, partial [Bacteroidota bacterium]|nr:hypothetical protein [Bacteroidota bacterium]
MENDNEKTVRQNRIIPFVLALPKDGDRYLELLNTSQSITMRSGLVVLQEGENVGSHNTGQHEEILIILNGCGEVE